MESEGWLRATRRVLVVARLLCLSCAGGPCTTSGKGGSAVLAVLISIVEEVDTVESSGDARCEVSLPSSDCNGPQHCFNDFDGVDRNLAEVQATARGTCLICANAPRIG